jgi:hypothetical protein
MSVLYGAYDPEESQPAPPAEPAPEPAVQYQAAQSIPTMSDNLTAEYQNDLGEKYEYDPDFRGAVGERKCTDVCMLIIFIIFICGMLGLFFYALTISNPKFLYIPTDYRNLLCGYDNSKLAVNDSEHFPNLEDYPYLFWTRPGKKGYVRSYCVKECPNEGLFSDVFKENLASNYSSGENGTICGTSNKTRRLVRGYDVPFIDDDSSVHYYCAYNTTKLIERCMPTFGAFEDIANATTGIVDDIKSNFSDMIGTNTLVTAVNDLYRTYPLIAVSLAATLVISFLWVLFMRYTAACFVWITVILAMAASILLTYLCWGQKENKWTNVNSAEAYTFGLYDEDLNHSVFNVFYIICIIWDCILFILIIGLFGRIKKSIEIIKIVSKVFAECKTLFIFPIIIYIIMFAWWVYVVAVAIVLFGAGKAEYHYDTENGIGQMIKYKYDNVVAGLSIYHFVGFLWISIFINDLGEMSIAGVFASWYFNKEPRREKMGPSPVWYSFKRSIRYHSGSLAFGSLIITIIKIIRYIIEYIRIKTKDTDNDAIKCLLKCATCICWCFEKFMKYINRNAYILIAIHGYNFFTACKNAFGLILRNCINVLTINWVGDFTLFLGRIFVTALVTSVSCFIFAHMDGVTFYVVPAAIVAVMAFFASDAFTGLFEIGIDSMFLCYMEDTERHDGSPGRELCGPPELVGFVSNSKAPPALVENKEDA